MRLRSALALTAGCVALIWIVWSVGFRVVSQDVALAGWALPATCAIFLVQLGLSAQAWRLSLGRAQVGPARIFRLRWIREGINALLPVAQIGGQVVGARLLVRGGISPALATAGTVLDVTLEAAAQLLFTLAGMVVLLSMQRGQGWLPWVGGGLAITGLAVAALVAVQRLGGMRLVERGLDRLSARWPAAAGWSIEGLHDSLMARQADRPALAASLALHTLSWALGGAEVFCLMAALGHAVSAVDAVTIESLGMAARSAGFAVPGAVGVQEGGFVLACGLFGVPPQDALAMSVLKRVREALVAVPALAAWSVSSSQHSPISHQSDHRRLSRSDD